MRRWLTLSSARTERLFLLGIALILLARYPIHFVFSPPYLMDFEVYRTTAERVVEGRSDQLYQPVGSERMVFKYAPPWALAFVSLAWGSKPSAAIAWTILGVLALLATLFLSAALCRRCGLPAPPWAGAAALLLAVRPLAEEMGNGQANLLWAALTAAFLVCMVQRRVWLAAAALSAAVLLKLPALIFLPYLALRRCWGLVGRTLLLSAAACIAASAALQPGRPLSLLHAWASALTRNAQAYAFEIGNQSFLALLSRFLTNDGYGLNVADVPRAWLAWAVVVLVAAGVLAAGGLGRSGPLASPRTLFDAALLMVLMVVGSPSCWLATYTALLLPLLVALSAGWHRLRLRRYDAAAILLGLLTLGLSAFTHRKLWRLLGLTHWRGESYLFLVFMILPWMALALMAWLWRVRSLSSPRPAA
jgi:hypothetical protein